jgi:SAM-dependent methyltransferase
MGMNTMFEWHHRYQQQARWTSDLRFYLYQEANIKEGDKVLDLGCGTGVLNDEIEARGAHFYGLDINYPSLLYASGETKSQRLIQGDGQFIPCDNNGFDLTICHFVLLWLKYPELCLKEMVRVTKPGGKIMALAEPDYGGRIDYPEKLTILGRLQTESLVNQGANPFIGRRLAGIFNQAGLRSVQTGVLGGQWSATPDWESWEIEWRVLETDLFWDKSSFKKKSFSKMKEIDRSAYETGERLLYVPTFYAWGTVK